MYLGLREREYTMFRKNKKNRLHMGLGSIGAYLLTVGVLVVNSLASSQMETCEYRIDHVYYALGALSMISCGVHAIWVQMPLRGGFTEAAMMMNIHFHLISLLLSFIGSLVILVHVQKYCRIRTGFLVYYWIFNITGLGYLCFYLVVMPIAGYLNMKDQKYRNKQFRELCQAIEELKIICLTAELQRDRSQEAHIQVIQMMKAHPNKERRFNSHLARTLFMYYYRYCSYLPPRLKVTTGRPFPPRSKRFPRVDEERWPYDDLLIDSHATVQSSSIVKCDICLTSVVGRYLIVDCQRYHCQCLWSSINTASGLTSIQD